MFAGGRPRAKFIVIGRTAHYGGPFKITTGASLFEDSFEMLTNPNAAGWPILSAYPLWLGKLRSMTESKRGKRPKRSASPPAPEGVGASGRRAHRRGAGYFVSHRAGRVVHRHTRGVASIVVCGGSSLDPITHALASLTLARAGRNHLPRYGTAMLLTTGVAADLDALSYFGGPALFLRFHRTLLHSLVGSLSIAFVTAAIFLAIENIRSKRQPGSQTPVRPGFGIGLVALVCVIGAGSHILLDLVSGIGIQLLWPFRAGWKGWELLTNIDLWILALLAGCSLVAGIAEARQRRNRRTEKSSRGRGAAITALVFLVLYIGSRAAFHSQAVNLLASREYHGRPPVAVAAFPLAATPFTWRGVVTTDATVEELPVSLLGGSEFDPDRTLTRYKAEPSAALDAGLRTSGGEDISRLRENTFCEHHPHGKWLSV